jgi:hypothetical protein
MNMPDFAKRHSKPQRALIAVDMAGNPVVLSTDGDWVAWDCANLSASADEIGLTGVEDLPERGLYLWEGTGQLVNHGAWDEPEELDTEYTGTLRRVAPEELAELYGMSPPEVIAPNKEE